ncbi:Hpt domain-containing protein [Idiomarina aminovorans]|uniref:Hpt domain-containing protein n=1 Tax=Idiomarina aminovorans TaxID=2914829 RepID=UPI0020030A79|nr:Hpt domain-containing protein [Idiomarina sp. ATCH4]MCK7459087.1 Hpt domain-containing protein [Idiomarina sp. ATCH4]
MSSNLAKIDFNQGLRHCDGQQELYRQVLNCYLDQFSGLLNNELLLNDVENARLQLHTLKSLSATIGASGLSHRAAQLFKDWQQHNRQQREEAIRQVNAHLKMVNEKIENYCNESVVNDSN